METVCIVSKFGLACLFLFFISIPVFELPLSTYVHAPSFLLTAALTLSRSYTVATSSCCHSASRLVHSPALIMSPTEM